MFSFHGSDTVALDTSETLKSVANLIASAQRGTAKRRRSLLTQEMRNLITIDDNKNIVVSYLAFCDLLGSRTIKNNVMLREAKTSTILRRVKRKVNGLRRIGLDVFNMSWARFGQGDIGLVITPSFKHDDEAIPSFFRVRATEPTMNQIFADGERISNRKVA